MAFTPSPPISPADIEIAQQLSPPLDAQSQSHLNLGNVFSLDEQSHNMSSSSTSPFPANGLASINMLAPGSASHPLPPLPDEQTLYLNLLHRTPPSRPFIYGVKSTNVYCVPGCPARLARRSNIQFFPDPSAARVAGYRPCKRCQPDESFAPFENKLPTDYGLDWTTPSWNDYGNPVGVQEPAGLGVGQIWDFNASITDSVPGNEMIQKERRESHVQAASSGVTKAGIKTGNGNVSASGKVQSPGQRHGESRIVLPAQKRQAEAVAKACELLREGRKGGGRLSVGDVAKEVGLTKWHFGRVFRRIMGVGPGEWSRRLEERGPPPPSTTSNVAFNNNVSTASGWPEEPGTIQADRQPVNTIGVMDKSLDFSANYDTPDSGASSVDNLWWRDMGAQNFMVPGSTGMDFMGVEEYSLTPPLDVFDWNQFVDVEQPVLTDSMVLNMGEPYPNSVEF